MEWKLGGSAIAMIAASFGFARYGYGLFEPQIRAEFGLSLGSSGQVASTAYLGYVIALMVVGTTVTRIGPRPLIAASGVLAAVGMVLIVVADQRWMLFVGLSVAGASSGFVWAPFSDAIAQLIAPARRDTILAAIPSGTAFGIALAGGLALLTVGTTWRRVFIVFSALAVLATVYNIWLLRATRPIGHARGSDAAPTSVGAVPGRGTLALYLTSLSYGAVGATYWTFAVAAISRATPGASSTSLVFWTLLGVAGVSGIWSGKVISWLGLRRTHTLLLGGLAVATALIAAAPGWWPAVGVSAILYGPIFMAISGLLAVWSYDVFPDRPAAGLNITVCFLGLGAVVGPAGFGALADLWDLRLVLFLLAAIAVVTIGARPRVTTAHAAGRR